MISQDFTQKSWKNFRFSLEKYSDELISEYLKYATKATNKWEQSVKHAVGKQLPKQYWHSKRPNSRKLFPYKNTGSQQDSVLAGVTRRVSGQGNINITAWGQIKAPYAHYTNEGKPARAKGNGVAWKGWETDVFEGGRGKLTGMSDIFDKIAGMRSIL